MFYKKGFMEEKNLADELDRKFDIRMYQDYETVKKIAEGEFGSIYLVQDFSERFFVKKLLCKKKINETQHMYECAKTEFNIMKSEIANNKNILSADNFGEDGDDYFMA